MKKLLKSEIRGRDRARLELLLKIREKGGIDWRGAWTVQEYNDEINFLKEAIKRNG